MSIVFAIVLALFICNVIIPLAIYILGASAVLIYEYAKFIAKWYLIISIVVAIVTILIGYNVEMYIGVLILYTIFLLDFTGKVKMRWLAVALAIIKLVSIFFIDLNIGYLFDAVGLTSLLIVYKKEAK